MKAHNFLVASPEYSIYTVNSIDYSYNCNRRTNRRHLNQA